MIKKVLVNIIYFSLLLFLIFSDSNIYAVDSLNNIIDVGTDIYVQHDSNNNDIYLLDFEGEETIVYKIINVTYTASKQWTRDGLYIDDLSGKIGATAPDDYIRVKENEVYFVRLYGIGEVYKGVNGDEWHITTPIVYFDDNGNCVGHALSSTVSASKKGVEITIPAGATRMYISNYNNQNITIQKKLVLKEEEFNQIKSKQDEILNYIDTNYENITSDQVIYGELDKGYITFVNDDSKPNVDKFADLFILKNIPLCFAAVADNLLNNSSNLIETRLQVALRIQEAGGEILAHSAPVITSSTINDNNFMYNYFIVQKQLLNNMGLNVNGIILAGGTGQITGSSITAQWVSSIYKYSDLLGEKYNTLLGIDSVYYHPRTGLGNYNNDIDKIKADIDKVIEEKSWKVFYFHDTNEVSLETLSQVLDYINSKSDNELEVVTYSTMYEKFAARESKLKGAKKTYYVSSDGTSNDGTDINDPISLQTLNNKKIKTGDTILFKSGDTFFGTINFSITYVDDEYVTISNYGEGELPTISTYKYIGNNWEMYSDSIYRIDIKNINNYTGYTSDSIWSFNVGFLESDDGNKYYNKKVSIESLENLYDFYSDGSQYLYIYSNENPYKVLGNLKVVVRSNLMNLKSNMNVSNIRFAYTGGHALEGADVTEKNIVINNCIIENIGGSYLYSNSLSNDTRYGNGIEFYGSNASNIEIKNNIIRNVYDVGFTIQGQSGSGNNIHVHNNVFVNNTQDSEIWENGTATGVVDYQFYNNLSINQGRGWGYDARPDKYAAAHILFWGYNIKNTDINFYNNTVYNPRRIYFIEQTYGTNIYFKENDIKSDNNIYYFNTDTKLYRDEYDLNTKLDFMDSFGKDFNSKFDLIIPDINVLNIANESNDIRKIRSFVIEDENYIEKIKLLNVPNNIELIQYEGVLDISDFMLELEYTNGEVKQVNVTEDMIKDLDISKLGRQLITVEYNGKNTTFEITVVSKVTDDNSNEDQIIDKPIEEKPNEDQIVEKPTIEKPNEDQIVGKPTIEKPNEDQIVDKPTDEKPSGDQIVDKPTDDSSNEGQIISESVEDNEKTQCNNHETDDNFINIQNVLITMVIVFSIIVVILIIKFHKR